MRGRTSLAAILLLMLVGGCGSAIAVNKASSPLGKGGSGFEECWPDANAGPVTYGVIVLNNSSATPVTLERVSLYGAHDLRVVRVVSVPIRHNAIGVGPWPQVRQGLTQPGVQWAQRIPAAGSKVLPADSHSLNVASRRGLLRNIVFELRPTALRSTAAGEVVRYRQGKHQYEYKSADKITVIIAKSVGNC